MICMKLWPPVMSPDVYCYPVGLYFANTIQKNYEDSMGGGVLTPPLGTPVGLPKATARVDSRLKLTIGKLVSKSTHHVRQVDYLIVGL